MNPRAIPDRRRPRDLPDPLAHIESDADLADRLAAYEARRAYLALAAAVETDRLIQRLRGGA